MPGVRTRGAAAVLLGLLLLGVLQAVAVLTASGLPSDVRLTALREGFSDRTDGDVATVGVQLRNDGSDVEVLGVGRDGPGLELVDVYASGEPVGFRAVGQGDALLPRFTLPRDVVVVLTLSYRVRDCDLVPRRPFPLTVLVRSGDADGVLEVPLPTYPSEREGARDGEDVQWQTALVRDLCDR